jgi:hypothetical protein
VTTDDQAESQRRSSPRGTTIETHPECAAIETALARGTPLRKIQARWGIHPSAACRHRQRMRLEQPETFRALAAADWKVKPEELEKLRTETSVTSICNVILAFGGSALVEQGSNRVPQGV